MSPRNLIRFGTLVTAAALVLQPAFGQGKGGAAGSTAGSAGTAGSTSGNTGAAGPTTGLPTRTPPTTTPTPTQPQPQQPTQPIFISGRVMLEDGSSPTESVTIERVCSGSPHAEGYTDSKGYFSIRLGDVNNGVMQDASEETRFGAGGIPMSTMGTSGTTSSMGRFGENRYFDCELRARLAGYRSQSVSLANRRPMDPPDVGVILLHRLGASEGTTVSAAALGAPKDARKAFSKGLEALKKHKLDDAVKNFQKTVDIYPKHAAAWVELGRIRLGAGDAVEARAYFEKAAQAEPKFAMPYLEMAIIEYKAQHWPQLAELSAKVVSLDSFDFPQAHFLNAVANYYLKDLDAAEKSAREAVRLDTRKEYASTFRLLGVILAQKQDYTGAADQFKAYLATGPQANDAAAVRNQLAQVEKLLAAKQ